MGNSGAKKTNQMLSQQQGLSNAAGNTAGARSGAEYDWRTGQRQNIADQYWNLYKGLDANGNPVSSGGGGGGGAPAWVDPATAMRQSVYDKYSDLANTGGWTPEDMAGYRSWTTAPISGFYTGLKNQLQQQNAATGGYAGYNSQAAKMDRDAARQGFQTAQESESGLQQMIRDAKLKGIEGMGSEAEAISAASRPRGGGGGGGGGGSDDKGDYYLRQLTGLMGGAEDLPYAGLQQSGYNSGSQDVRSRVDETPGWQKALMQVVPAAASAGLGMLTGGASSFRRPTPSYSGSTAGMLRGNEGFL